MSASIPDRAPTVPLHQNGRNSATASRAGGGPREPVRGRHRRAPEPTRHNGPLLWTGQVINTSGLMMLVPIMPFYVAQLGVSGVAAASTWAGVAIAAPALALTVATPLWGRVGDRIGRKWMVVRALAGLALAMVVMAAAATPLMLVVGRLLQGTLGGVVEAVTAFAGAVGPRGDRGKALGRSFSAMATGSLVGPLIGGVLVTTNALPTFMIGLAGAAAVTAVACALGLREPPEPAQSPGRSDEPAQDLGKPRRAKWTALPAAGALAATATAAYFGIYGLIPVFAARVQKLTPSSAATWVGVLHAAMWGASLLTSTVWGRRNDRAGRPLQTMTIAVAGCAVAIIAQALITDPWWLVLPRLLLGACFAAIAQSLFLHVGNHSDERHRSGMVGTANSFLLAGQSAGPLAAGPLLAAASPATVIIMMAGACAIAALLANQAKGHRQAGMDAAHRIPAYQ